MALLTLDRPATRNALAGEAMFDAFETLFERMNADAEVRAAVLTGAGSAFCSGGDIANMRDRTGMFEGAPEEITRRYREGIQRIPRAFEMLEVPIVAAINGPAIGAGNDLACMCDICLASTEARFAESFVKVGIVQYVDATPVEIHARGVDRLWGVVAACTKPYIPTPSALSHFQGASACPSPPFVTPFITGLRKTY